MVVMRRPVLHWLALVASLLAAVLPPAALERTVCRATGDAAIGFTVRSGCALDARAGRPPCCEHESGERDEAPRAPDRDDCCDTSPALAPATPPQIDGMESGPPPPLALLPAAEPGPALRACARRGHAPPSTGPPDHGLRRHLQARRGDLLTI